MPKLNIQKSIEINASIDTVYRCISDFNQWVLWSPWLIMEPEAKVVISDDSSSYSWEGKRVGSGQMKISGEEKNKWVNYDLSFFKPWKSEAKVRFELEKLDDKIKATWYMNSSIPFFMFWMQKMMTAFIEMDYERGLSLLKDLAEDGEVHSKLEFIGQKKFQGCQYIGIKTKCSIDTVGLAMSKDFEEISAYLSDKQELISGEFISIYHKWDVVKHEVSYTSGIPVNEMPADLPLKFIFGKIPETSVYKLRHIGPYAHLGNAWTTMMSMHRNKEFKPKKGIHPFETYKNSPAEVAEKELITDINFAIQ